MQLTHQLPSKVYYLDRLGNMSTSSSCITTASIGGGSTSSLSASSTASGPNTGSVRKQILPLKPKQPISHVQHLEMKGKPQEIPCVPVTMLELKKKEKSDKNIVTMLTYRKPSTLSSSGSSDHHHHSNHHLPMVSSKRPGSPSSSGYETDSLVDQENCDVFSNILGSGFSFSHHEMDMLHAHPIWSPQAVNNSVALNNNVMSAINHHHRHGYGFSDDQFLVQ